ncbi:MAG: GNAT family N-acetyltransferase [Bacteroidetes bacterium]|nr:GNAT family N-acetyltransferase [Bacteroidota bacterium]
MDIIKTNRLEIVEITIEDTPFIFELLNTPSWIKFIGDRGIKTENDAKNYILNKFLPAYSTSWFGFRLVRMNDSKTPIGIAGLVKRDALEHIDIGFAFLPQYEGKGYGFESAAAIMEYAETTLGIKTIAGITNADNTRSIALLEKLGLRYQKMILLPNETEEIMLFLKQ